jgi:hypothetical protein
MTGSTETTSSPLAVGDIDGDRVIDPVWTTRLGPAHDSDCPLEPEDACDSIAPSDKWRLTAELSSLGRRELVFRVLAIDQAYLGQVWGVTDADGDGLAEIFIGAGLTFGDTTPGSPDDDRRWESPGSDHGLEASTLGFAVVRVIDDVLVLVTREPGGECLPAQYKFFDVTARDEAIGFACRDELPELPGRELVTMAGMVPEGGDGSVLEGSQSIYRWAGDNVELVEIRPMTGPRSDFERIACAGVGSPPSHGPA